MNQLRKVLFAATGRELHIDVPLSNVAIDYRPEAMIADLICPIVPVNNLTNIVPKFGRRDWLRAENDHRAPGNEARKIHRSVGSESYLCTNHALKTGVTLEDRNNADAVYAQRLYNGAAEWLKSKLMLNWEVRIAAQVTSGTNIGSYSAISSAWTDHTNSDPLSDCFTAMYNVEDSTGKSVNRVVFGKQAFREIRQNTIMRNIVFGVNNGGGFMTEEKIANLLGIDKVLVGQAYLDDSNEAQSESLDHIWGDHVLFYFAPLSPSIYVPSFMYAFRWSTGNVPNMQVERHPWDSKKKEEEIELGYYQDEKITGADYAFLLTNVTSST